jgi:hypothetical protein
VELCLHSYSYGVHRETGLCSTSIKFCKRACIKSGSSGRTEFRLWKRLTCSPADFLHSFHSIYNQKNEGPDDV